MTFLLDTNACIALINGWPMAVGEHSKQALDSGHAIAASVVVAYELWYGVAKSTRREANTAALETFLSGPVDLMPFDEADAREAGEIRATDRLRGGAQRPLGDGVGGHPTARETSAQTVVWPGAWLLAWAANG